MSCSLRSRATHSRCVRCTCSGTRADSPQRRVRELSSAGASAVAATPAGKRICAWDAPLIAAVTAAEHGACRRHLLGHRSRPSCQPSVCHVRCRTPKRQRVGERARRGGRQAAGVGVSVTMQCASAKVHSVNIPTCTRRCATSGQVMVPICLSLRAGAGWGRVEVDGEAEGAGWDGVWCGHARTPWHAHGSMQRSGAGQAELAVYPAHAGRQPGCSQDRARRRMVLQTGRAGGCGGRQSMEGSRGTTTKTMWCGMAVLHLMPSLWLQKCLISARSRTSTTKCA